MHKPESGNWKGTLSLERLFGGSKSEGLYPVLRSDDDRVFRVHVRGSETSDADALAEALGHRVVLSGVADMLRGHWRLQVDPGAWTVCDPAVVAPDPGTDPDPVDNSAPEDEEEP